jgi:hypothetical protein
MNPGGQLPRPNPWNGKPFPKGQETILNPMNQTANYSAKDRIYDDWIIKDYLQQGIILPIEVKDIGKPGYKQVIPRPIQAPKLAMNKGMDNWQMPGGTYNGTFRQDGYGDPNTLDQWGQDEWWDRDEDFYPNILDPGMEGPLSFS